MLMHRRVMTWLLCWVSTSRFVLAPCINYHPGLLPFNILFFSPRLLSSVRLSSSETGSSRSKVAVRWLSSGVDMSRAPASSSHYIHTCKPAHHSPPQPRSLHKSKKESDREGRRDPERKKCERLGGWENSPLDVCSVRCAQRQGDWHSGREMPTPGSWTASCCAKGALCYIRYGITGEGAACDEAEAGWALQLRFVFLQHSCWGHYHMLLLVLLLHHCRSQMCALLVDWV